MASSARAKQYNDEGCDASVEQTNESTEPFDQAVLKLDSPKRSRKPLIFAICGVAVVCIIAALVIFFANRTTGLLAASDLEQELNAAYETLLKGYSTDHTRVPDFTIEDVDEETHDQIFVWFASPFGEDAGGLAITGEIKNGQVIEIMSNYIGFTDSYDQLDPTTQSALLFSAALPAALFTDDIDSMTELAGYVTSLEVVNNCFRTVDDNVEYMFASSMDNIMVGSTFNVRYLPAFETSYYDELFNSTDFETETDASTQVDPQEASATDESIDSDTMTDWEMVYAVKISEYGQVAAMDAETFDQAFEYGSDCRSINALMMSSFVRGVCEGDLRYTIYDIDSNRTPELIFAISDTIIDIYTVHDDTVVKLFEDCYFGQRSNVYLLTDGRLLEGGSYSLTESGYSIYQINDSTGSLQTITTYYINSSTTPVEVTVDAENQITEAEFNHLANGWREDDIIDTLHWTTLVTQREAPHEHDFGEWFNDGIEVHVRFCSCGEEEVQPHSFDEGSVTREPTTTSTGVRTSTCTECGATSTTTIDKIQHTHSFGYWSDDYNGSTHSSRCSCGYIENEFHLFDSGVVYIEPTVSSTGVKYYTCYTCGATKEETIPKLEQPYQPTLPDVDYYDHQQICWACNHNDGTKRYTAYRGQQIDVSWTCSACGTYNSAGYVWDYEY